MMEIFNKILPYAVLADTFQWLAFAFNIMYVILAAKGNVWCWVWGFFGTIFQFIVCLDADLKSDAALQVYYSFSAIYGWMNWSKKNDSVLSISTLPMSMHVKIILIGIALALPLGYYWHIAAFRYADSILTVFSILTTFLTARKILESWLYWLLIDLSYAFIYYERDKFILAFLSLIYFSFSIRGYLNWKKDTVIYT